MIFVVHAAAKMKPSGDSNHQDKSHRAHLGPEWAPLSLNLCEKKCGSKCTTNFFLSLNSTLISFLELLH